MSGRNARRMIFLALFWAISSGTMAGAGDSTVTLTAARENVRLREAKAFAADPALRTMQAWLEEGQRLRQAEDFVKLERQAAEYLNTHQSDDELMSAYYALRSSFRQLADHKNTARVLKDAQLRKSWLELRREALAKSRSDIRKSTSLTRVEKLVSTQMAAEDKDAAARVKKLLAAHALPDDVVRYVQRWAESEARVALAQAWLDAKAPGGLKAARRQLEEVERDRGEMRKGAPAAPPPQAAAPTTATLPGSLKAALRELPPERGPDVVMLRELENTYEPVPFEHKAHAQMAQMWQGCVTCHHRSPQPGARQVASTAPAAPERRTQEAAAQTPACKTCHRADPAAADIRMPSLKAAYHRQCLNCHKEWMRENACLVCHKARKDGPAPPTDPTPDDIVGRMHPPLPEPETKTYKARFTPPDGGNVLFRHREHTAAFGIKCVSCHHQDNCVNCHNPVSGVSAQKPLHPGMTWGESHDPCIGCHQQDRCQHCHYRDEQQPPGSFDHLMTGQQLDKDHARLACGQCHASLERMAKPTCGDASCHPRGPVAYPAQRPGPSIEMRKQTPLPTATPAHARMAGNGAH